MANVITVQPATKTSAIPRLSALRPTSTSPSSSWLRKRPYGDWPQANNATHAIAISATSRGAK
jgi:hypothetical protein